MAEEMLAPACPVKSKRLEPGFGLRDAGHVAPAAIATAQDVGLRDAGHFAPAAIKRGLRETSRIAPP